MNNIEMKPKLRSKFRVYLGTRYYRIVRHLKWIFDDHIYSKTIGNKRLEYEIVRHASPIYRELKDVDMWLQENKAHNLSIAISKVNGIIIRPCETFSYWKLIGKPTKSKGYKNGMVLYYGDFKAGIGGGLCQTTINAG